MANPLVFITGANQGIGLAAAKILASQHSCHVLIGARNSEAGEKAASEIRDAGHKASFVKLDLMSRASVEAAVKTITDDYGYLDVLINNAGILIDTKVEDTWDRFADTFTTNVVGPAVLTEGLLPLLRKAKIAPPRIVFVSSTMGSIQVSTDKTTAWYPIDYKAYDASKAAVSMLTVNFARELDEAGGKVNVVCPGLVSTNMTGYMPQGTSTEVGAAQVVKMALIGEDGPTRTFSRADGPVPW